MGLRDMLRRRRQPVARIDPDPLRSPDDATELGLLIGLTGNEQTPWNAVAMKNLMDKHIASGAEDDRASSPRAAAHRPGAAPDWQ